MTDDLTGSGSAAPADLLAGRSAARQAFTWWPGRRCQCRIFVVAARTPPSSTFTGAQQREVGEHLDDEHDPGGLGFALMSPKPTVADGHAAYRRRCVG